MWWLSFRNFVSTVPDGSFWNCCVQVWKGGSFRPPVSVWVSPFCVSVQHSSWLQDVLALYVKMWPCSSKAFSPGINVGSLSSLVFPHSLLSSLQCSLSCFGAVVLHGGVGRNLWWFKGVRQTLEIILPGLPFTACSTRDMHNSNLLCLHLYLVLFCRNEHCCFFFLRVQQFFWFHDWSLFLYRAITFFPYLLFIQGPSNKDNGCGGCVCVCGCGCGLGFFCSAFLRVGEEEGFTMYWAYCQSLVDVLILCGDSGL